MRMGIHEIVKAMEEFERIKLLFNYSTQINNGTTIDTGWFNVKKFDKVRLSGTSDATLNISISWSDDASNNVNTESLTIPENDSSGNEFSNYSLYVMLSIDNSSGNNATSLRINLIGVK